MDKVKQQFKTLQLYFPFAFSALIVYFAIDPASGAGVPPIMLFLPLCFFWLGESLRQHSKESSELRQEVTELKKMLDELRMDS